MTHVYFIKRGRIKQGKRCLNGNLTNNRGPEDPHWTVSMVKEKSMISRLHQTNIILDIPHF
jgi:hypothetical protein